MAARAASRPTRSERGWTGCWTRCAAVDGDVLAFAHGHSLRVLTARWLGLEVATGAHFKLAAAAVSVLGHERVTPTIDRWSV